MANLAEEHTPRLSRSWRSLINTSSNGVYNNCEIRIDPITLCAHSFEEVATFFQGTNPNMIVTYWNFLVPLSGELEMTRILAMVAALRDQFASMSDYMPAETGNRWQIMRQLSEGLRIMAEVDFPKKWQELLPELASDDWPAEGDTHAATRIVQARA